MLLFSQILIGQNNNDYYMDDEELLVPEHIVKLNITGLILGRIDCYYERKLFKSIKLEAGAGVQLPYYSKELGFIFSNPNNKSLSEESPLRSGVSGFHWSLQVMTTRRTINSYFISNGIRFRKAYYSYDGYTFKQKEYSFISAGRMSIHPKWSLELASGVSFVHLYTENIDLNWYGVFIPLDLKLIYKL
ncbi:MAG: hypothetical protein ACPGSD_03670 [Flavobacteriales bacterium]